MGRRWGDPGEIQALSGILGNNENRQVINMQYNMICKSHEVNGRGPGFSGRREKLSGPVGFGMVLFQLICGINLASNVSAAAVIYGAEGNPTGNPMGGGPGYSSMVMPSEADYTVENKTQLLSALASAGEGQIIYITDYAEINLTGERGIKIPGNVTLASGRGRNSVPGGLIYTDEFYASLYPFLLADGENVRLTGLRLRGPDREIGDHHYSPYHLGRGIQTGYPLLEVDNCELWGWGHAAILFTKGAINAHIHHNYIHHNRRSGYGYGVCHGYSTETELINSVIEANIFDYCRHHIAGTGTPGLSYEARYNICLGHDNGHCFDMHGGADRGDGTDIAGDLILIHHNTFRDSEVTAIGIRGIPQEEAQIHHNWFYHANESVAVRQSNASGNLNVYSNFYGSTPPAGTSLPMCIPNAYPTDGPLPLKVVFNGSYSYALGGAITSLKWLWGDGNTTIGKGASGTQASYTYNDPGRYNVNLTVKDDMGIPASGIIPISVFPVSRNCLLSLWVKDSYRGDLANYFQKEILVNGEVVWQDDVEGDEGWVHVLTEVKEQAGGKDAVTLTLRVRCLTGVTDPQNEIIELFTYWDDVILFGFDLENGDFEAPGGWNYSEQGSVWRGWRYSGDVRSGNHTYRLYYPYMGQPGTGSWARIEREMTNTPPAILAHTPDQQTVLVDTNIAITFSEPMLQNSVENAFAINPVREGGFYWEGNKVIFNPSKNLTYGENYTIYLNSSAMDLGGKNLESDYTWQFTTINARPGEKIVVYPNPYIDGKSRPSKIRFSNLVNTCTIKIFSVSGKLVKTIEHQEAEEGGSEEWDVSEVSSGVYVFLIKSPTGVKQGKISVIK